MTIRLVITSTASAPFWPPTPKCSHRSAMIYEVVENVDPQVID